jgi:hypothetical protein
MPGNNADATRMFEYACLLLGAGEKILSLEDRQSAEEIGSMCWKDQQIEIYFGPVPRSAGRPALGIYVSVRGENTGDTQTVLIGYRDRGRDVIARFVPGPWCAHLRVYGPRAAAVLRDREP